MGKIYHLVYFLDKCTKKINGLSSQPSKGAIVRVSAVFRFVEFSFLKNIKAPCLGLSNGDTHRVVETHPQQLKYSSLQKETCRRILNIMQIKFTLVLVVHGAIFR